MARNSLRPPTALLALAFTLTFTLASGAALAQHGSGKAPTANTATNTAASKNAYTLPDKYPVPVPAARQHTPNTMLEAITPEARNRFVQSSLGLSPLSLRDWINLLAYKVEARPGLSYDDVVASMKARANKINFKFVGVNAIWKDVAASTGKATPRVEIFNFCDANIARELLDYSLEFVIFLPCRIAVVEDAEQKIWLLMLDWDVRWVDDIPNPDRISDPLRQGATKLREGLEDIIQAGANGDL